MNPNEKNEFRPTMDAEFTTAATNVSQIPTDGLPQVAFLGRSNVGKSSLLNALTGRKNLVKVSSKPGKTKEINFFKFNQAFYLVDLPGYGYAKIAKSDKVRWSSLIEGYLMSDRDIALVFQLIDMRYEKKSTILTTNMNFNEWDGIFYDAVVANAIMDRVLHHSHVITISGRSYRLKDHIKPTD